MDVMLNTYRALRLMRAGKRVIAENVNAKWRRLEGGSFSC